MNTFKATGLPEGMLCWKCVCSSAQYLNCRLCEKCVESGLDDLELHHIVVNSWDKGVDAEQVGPGKGVLKAARGHSDPRLCWNLLCTCHQMNVRQAEGKERKLPCMAALIDLSMQHCSSLLGLEKPLLQPLLCTRPLVKTTDCKPEHATTYAFAERGPHQHSISDGPQPCTSGQALPARLPTCNRALCTVGRS
eukprot:scaffold8070_cov18-Tisochrysis_lutea.AAC.1